MKQGICALLLLLTACGDEPQKQPEKKVETEYFDRVWKDSASKVALAAPKVTDRIIPTPPEPKVEVAIAEPEPEPAPAIYRRSKKVREVRRERRSRGDVCQRHKMRKVFVGKYKWRCRK